MTRSFQIAWRHKYLWLIALFSGESGGGPNFNYQQSLPTKPGTSTPDFGSGVSSVNQWVGDHAALIILLAALILLFWVALFVLAAACEAATIRGSAEHDAERPFGLGSAWQAGRASTWAVVRLRLIIFALILPAIVILIALLVGFLAAIFGGAGAAAVGLGLLFGLLVLAFIPYAIYVGFLDKLGTRAVVLELIGARAALGRASGLIRKRLGRLLLVWLLSIAVGIAVGIAVLIATIAIAIPLLIGIGVTAATGSGIGVGLIVLGVLIFLPIALVISGFLAAQSSTYWTLAFRRLDLDQAPALGYQAAYPPQPIPPAAAQGLPPA